MPDPSDIQDLRIALVMNGGVSLAVWMGGVTRELDRVRRGDGPYGGLLELVRAEARIDVIAGASAGGINGAVLAMAIARDRTVDEIRDLWMNLGSIADLLRDPMEADAPSVLQGDGRLLDGLRKAMRKIAGDAEASRGEADDAPPLHLVITTSPLEGRVTRYPDRFGATIADVSHRGLFHFRRLPKQPGAEQVDDFAEAGAGDKLALAARSSASFPGAFEPSFVPVGAGSDEAHPDMGGIADFGGSRWAIDGGVLDNTPFRPALDAIRSLPGEAPVRRVLGYVVPEPMAPKDESAQRDQMPPVRDVVVAALSRLPRVQSIGRELEEIEENNRTVRHRRDARRHTLTAAGGALEGMARALLPAYVEIRRQGAVYEIVGLLLEGAAPEAPPGPARIAELRTALAAPGNTHWLPASETPGSWDALELSPWRWGFAPIQNAANVALELLQLIVALPQLTPAERAAAMGQRWLLHDFLRRLRELNEESAAHWRDAGSGSFPDVEQAGALADAWGERFPPELTRIARGIARVVVDSAALVPASDDAGGRAREARELADALVDAAAPSTDGTLLRLLALDVVQRSSGADLTGLDQSVELVLMSADSASSLGAAKSAKQKLAGLQFHHFGGFYKRSWRANDWMWGRLDGADRLVRTLLDPRRVQRRLHAGESAADLAEEVARIVCDPGGPDTGSILEDGWRQRVRDELEQLADLEGEPPPTALKAAYEAIRARVQIEVLADELPGVVEAVGDDLKDGAAADSLGAQWVKHLGPLETPKQLVTAFDACEVAKETLAQEAGSDYFTKVSTKAGGVAGSVLRGSIPDRKLLRLPHAVLTTLRGVLLALYLLGRGVVDPENRTGRFLAALALAAGGVLVAVYSLGVAVPGFLLLLGVTLVIAGIALAYLRGHTIAQLALAAALVAAAIGGFYVVRIWHDRPRWADALAAVFAVIVAAVAAMWLGSRGKRKRPT